VRAVVRGGQPVSHHPRDWGMSAGVPRASTSGLTICWSGRAGPRAAQL
jgi:hypothetical protein